jgi:hypothetical protein
MSTFTITLTTKDLKKRIAVLKRENQIRKAQNRKYINDKRP